jgi:hypothetical protein
MSILTIQQRTQSGVRTDTCTCIFITALFTKARMSASGVLHGLKKAQGTTTRHTGCPQRAPR